MKEGVGDVVIISSMKVEKQYYYGSKNKQFSKFLSKLSFFYKMTYQLIFFLQFHKDLHSPNSFILTKFKRKIT